MYKVFSVSWTLRKPAYFGTQDVGGHSIYRVGKIISDFFQFTSKLIVSHSEVSVTVSYSDVSVIAPHSEVSLIASHSNVSLFVSNLLNFTESDE